jgi:hypothetical protein
LNEVSDHRKYNSMVVKLFKGQFIDLYYNQSN